VAAVAACVRMSMRFVRGDAVEWLRWPGLFPSIARLPGPAFTLVPFDVLFIPPVFGCIERVAAGEGICRLSIVLDISFFDQTEEVVSLRKGAMHADSCSLDLSVPACPPACLPGI